MRCVEGISLPKFLNKQTGRRLFRGPSEVREARVQRVADVAAVARVDQMVARLLQRRLGDAQVVREVTGRESTEPLADVRGRGSARLPYLRAEIEVVGGRRRSN
jgi:hypothetical protein